MIRLYDSIRVSDVKRVASTQGAAVAGYVDGTWADYTAMVSAFPHDRHLSIAARPSDDADCLDVETGDAKPQDVPAWALRQHHRGVWRPVVYASTNVWPQIEEELRKANLPGVFVRRWLASWNGQADVPAGYDAHQFTDRANGQNVDESVCLDDFFGVAPRRFVAQIELTEGSWQWSVRPQPFHTPPLG